MDDILSWFVQAPRRVSGLAWPKLKMTGPNVKDGKPAKTSPSL